MSEIGSGQGSSYSGTLDTNASVELDAPNAGKTKARAAVVNDLSACIIAVETTLGVDPQGTKATVVARINQEHNADGSHKDTLIVTVSGHNQSISGRKIFASGISLGVDGLYGTATGPTTGRTTVGASGSMWLMDDVKTSGSFIAAVGLIKGLNIYGDNIYRNNYPIFSKINEAIASNAAVITLPSTPSTTIATLGLGNVLTGQRILCIAEVSSTKGGTAGLTRISILKDSGSASIDFYGLFSTAIQQGYHPASTNMTISISTIMRITGNGTLTIALEGLSAGSNASIATNDGVIHAIVIE